MTVANAVLRPTGFTHACGDGTTTQVTVPETQQHLPELLVAAEAGEAVMIRGDNGRTFALTVLPREPIMIDTPQQLSCEIELGPGEQLTLPRSLVERIGPGRWLITVQRRTEEIPVRDHAAFLRSFGTEDEGLYDDYAAG